MVASKDRPFSIKIFLPDGNPDGLRIIDRSNWSGRGVVFPRALFPNVRQRPEFNQAGVYVLIGPSETSDLPVIYIGEADPIRPRIESHHAKKDFWTWAAFFVSKDDSLNKAHVQHLESRLIQLAQDARRATLDNQNAPQVPALSEAEAADVENFLSDILSIFPLVGLSAFEKAHAPENRRETLRLLSKGITAEGYESEQGFVVLKGSQAVLKGVPSIHRLTAAFRSELHETGVLITRNNHYEFSQDYVFNSPSAAANVILGSSANGRIEWKDKNGRTLREIQESDSDTNESS